MASDDDDDELIAAYQAQLAGAGEAADEAVSEAAPSSAVSALLEVGFARTDCEAAVRAVGDDPDRSARMLSSDAYGALRSDKWGADAAVDVYLLHEGDEDELYAAMMAARRATFAAENEDEAADGAVDADALDVPEDEDPPDSTCCWCFTRRVRKAPAKYRKVPRSGRYPGSSRNEPPG